MINEPYQYTNNDAQQRFTTCITLHELNENLQDKQFNFVCFAFVDYLLSDCESSNALLRCLTSCMLVGLFALMVNY